MNSCTNCKNYCQGSWCGDKHYYVARPKIHTCCSHEASTITKIFNKVIGFLKSFRKRGQNK
jgi:hypothetical protein